MKSIDEYAEYLIATPYKRVMEVLAIQAKDLTSLKMNTPEMLEHFKGHITELEQHRSIVEHLELVTSLEPLVTYITADIEEDEIKVREQKEEEVNKILDSIDSLKESIEVSNKASNDSLRAKYLSSNSTYEALEDKRKALEDYSDRIFDKCSAYGIKTSDTGVDNTTFTSEQLDSLYDKYLKFLEKEETSGNPIRAMRNLITDWRALGVIMIVIILACFTQILDILSIVFFLMLIINQIRGKDKLKYYTVLMGIVFNVKPLELGYRELPQDMLLPEELTDDMMDSDSRFDSLSDELEAIDNKYGVLENDSAISKFMTELEQKKADFNARIKKNNTEFLDGKDKLLATYNNELDILSKKYAKLISEFKGLGRRFGTNLKFNTRFVLGLRDDVVEETVDIGMKNVIIRQVSDSDRMNQFLQCLYANAISNVFPGKLQVHVFDPNNFGRVLMPFYKQELDKVFIIHKDELTKLITTLSDYAELVLKTTGGRGIQDYNKECEEVGKTPLEYKLMIILSQPKTLEEDEALKSFFEYSAEQGVMIWAVSNNMVSDNAFTFRDTFNMVDHPINFIDSKWCQEVSANYVDAIKNTKTPSLMWQDFVDVSIPEDKIWTGDASSFIELYPGFLNGDPTSYAPYTVGNEGNVHILGVGGTGAGKSVFINHLIACITRLYDPSQVQLWLSDFKGTEFKYYLGNEEFPEILPHIKACLCTSDPDFATSLFKALRNMADDRYEKMKDIGVKNMPSWNKYWEQKASDTNDDSYLERRWPRVLFICDEFQVIFEKADPAGLASINADITQLAKVARAAGVHIFFTSQSMKKTVSADILQQFSLRFALRCDKDVSMDILGTDNASNITEKNGYLYVRSVEMTLKDQKRYRTPFIPDGDKPGKPADARKNIIKMANLAKEKGFKGYDIITYEEATLHPIAELHDTYANKEVQTKIPDSGVFFLGMPMAYVENKAPVNIVLTRKNNSHIFSIFTDYSDICRFFETIMVNISSNRESSAVIINSQVADLAYITEAEKYVKEPFKKLVSEKNTPADMCKWIKGLYEKRKNSGDSEKPVYIILMGWDKGQGIGVDPDPIMRSEFNNLLQLCGEFNIHVIFINTGVGSFSTATIDTAQYKICGKCDENSSLFMLGTKQGCKNYTLKTGWLFLNRMGNLTRCKLYACDMKHEIESDEIVI